MHQKNYSDPMKKPLIKILFIALFIFYGLLLSGQDFRGGDIRFTYQDSPLDIEINVNLYFYTAEGELGLDSVIIETEDRSFTVGLDEVVPLNRGVSVYRYYYNHNFLSIDGTTVISVVNTPAVQVDHQALIEDSLGIWLVSRLSNQYLFDSTLSVWDDFLFDYAIDEAGDLVFQLSGTDPNSDGSVAFGFSVELLFWRDQGWYEYPAPLEDLQLNTETGAFRWRNPPGPGKYLLGFDLHGLFPNTTVVNNMFTRYLVIELTEEDFMINTHTNNLVTPELSIYPNPTTTTTTLEYGGLNGEIYLKAINAQGQIMLQKTLNGMAQIQREVIDVSTWPAGVYWIELSNEQGQVTKKLVVE
jgi:hypothetical protein